MRIFDVARQVQHRLIIGDNGFVAGYIQGPINNWSTASSHQNISCIAPLSIVETPFGVVFLAADGLRIVDSLNMLGPYGREFLIELTDAVALSQSVGSYNQSTNEYLLFSQVGDVQFMYAFDIGSKAVRKISLPTTHPIDRGVQSIGGHSLFCNRDGAWKVESLIDQQVVGQDGEFYIDSGYRRFIPGDSFQQIRKIAITYSCDGHGLYVAINPEGSNGYTLVTRNDGTNAFPAQSETKTVVVNVSSIVAPAFAHSIYISQMNDESGSSTTRCQIDRVLVQANAVPSSYTS